MLAIRRDRWPRRIVLGVTALFVMMGLGLLASLLTGAWPLLGQPHALTNLLSGLWDPVQGRFGLGPFLIGTVVVTGIALVIAVPVSLGSAITLSARLSQQTQTSAIRVLTVLTAVPSVVFGWWGLLVIVPWIRGRLGGPGFSLLAAGMVLAVMLVPTLSLLYYHALRAVPQRYHEGSDALGATPDQTLTRVVIPCAWPALVPALLVAVARALGETIAVQMVIGGQTAIPTGLTGPGATLTTQILTDVTVFPPGTPGHAVIDIMALVLVVGMYLLVRASERWGTWL